MLNFTLLALAAVLSTACSSETQPIDGGGDSQCGLPVAVTAEASYCGSALQSPSSSVTVTGTANYEYRVADNSGLTNTIQTRPIRYAEIRITNSSGDLVQCGETDGSGNISIALPDDGGSYTVSVSSRADNSQVRVSVLDAPDTNVFYSVSETISASGSPSVSLVAEAKGTIVGGAFNIYDQIVSSNLYLESELANCNTSGTDVNGPAVDCSPFSTTSSSFVPSGKTSKAEVFWKAGFNPASYFCETAGVSFYVPDTDQIYILGGLDGDTDNSDTDHFDNSIIIHEFGHFLEDQYAATDSPGGFHDGNSVIDPRLAWSEGWAHFIQNAVLQDLDSGRDPVYQDTTGNADGSTSNLFYASLEYRCNNDANSATFSFQCQDLPTNTGEGNFREFAVARALWDAVDSNADTFDSPSTFTDNLSMPFSEIWTAFINLRDTALAFRSPGNFHELRNALTGDVTSSTSYDEVVNSGFQEPNRLDYANPMNLGGSCTTTITQASQQSNDDQFLSFDYFDLDHSGGTVSLDLSYTGVSSSSDVDIYLYQEDYVFENGTTLVAASNDINDGGSESISESLSAGRYLIVVEYYDGSNNQSYNLQLGGQKVCPETSF